MQFRQTTRFVFQVSLAAALLAGTLAAQTTGAGTLVGTVADSSGAVVAAAKVSVVNIDTAFHSETATNNDGAY